MFGDWVPLILEISQYYSASGHQEILSQIDYILTLPTEFWHQEHRNHLLSNYHMNIMLTNYLQNCHREQFKGLLLGLYTYSFMDKLLEGTMANKHAVKFEGKKTYAFIMMYEDNITKICTNMKKFDQDNIAVVRYNVFCPDIQYGNCSIGTFFTERYIYTYKNWEIDAEIGNKIEERYYMCASWHLKSMPIWLFSTVCFG